MPEEALGYIETRGYGALVRATDAMHKAAAVEKLDFVKIGSAYVTILCLGPTAAVKAAVNAGLAALGDHAGLVGSNVLPAPNREIINKFTTGEYNGAGKFGSALGVLETRGLSGMVTAHDAALDAAQVTTIGFNAVGSGLVSIILKGDVAAVEAAIEGGVNEVAGRADVHATEVIPNPHPTLVKAMIEKKARNPKSIPRAIGIVESRGFAGAFSACDAGLKAADVVVECWKPIGGGLVSVTFGGDVAGVTASVAAGVKAIERVSELTAQLVIPNPDSSVFSEM